jgi:hypothetical protein
MEEASCVHAGCACPTLSEGNPVCSGYCANVVAHESEPAACACGHEPCKDAQRVARAGKQPVMSVGGGPGRGID